MMAEHERGGGDMTAAKNNDGCFGRETMRNRRPLRHAQKLIDIKHTHTHHEYGIVELLSTCIIVK